MSRIAAMDILAKILNALVYYIRLIGDALGSFSIISTTAVVLKGLVTDLSGSPKPVNYFIHEFSLASNFSISSGILFIEIIRYTSY
jgi:hypothetical protein